MARLKLLGGPVLRSGSGGEGDGGARRHSIALLALLACAPDRTLSRGRLVALLWPESPDSAGRNRLNTHVHRLRAELGDDVIVSEGDGLRLAADALSCDVIQFQAALEEGRPEDVVASYGGPFLDGFGLPGSPAFERWAEHERLRLERAWRGALESLARAARERGDLEGAVGWWSERARADPWDSTAVRELARALTDAGRRGEALRTARRHARFLHEELGADEEQELDRLLSAVEGTADAPATSGPSERGGEALAVLPLEVPPDDAECGEFAAGLHQDLLTRLSAVAGITLISRASVLPYRSGDVDIARIAEDLGVDAVVQGGMRRSAGRIRLTLELSDVRTGRLRWAEAYDRELTAADLLDLQGELAGRIAGGLRAELDPLERARVEGPSPTRNLEAYRLQALGRARLGERTREGMERAVEHFRDALSLDPEYALAWVGLADALTLGSSYGHAERTRALPEASDAAHRALALDPSLGEAYASLGIIAEARYDGPRTIRNLWRSVALRPGYAEAHNWLSWNLLLLGRPADALDCAIRAVELNPLAPEAAANLTLSRLAMGDPARALRDARRVVELEPSWPSGAFLEALALYHLERFAEAEPILRNLSVPWTGRGAEATWALVLLRRGREDAARAEAARLEADGASFAAALLYEAFGDRDRSRPLLEAIGEWAFWPTLAFHHYYPRELDGLRSAAGSERLRARVYRAWGLAPDGSFAGAIGEDLPPASHPRTPADAWDLAPE